MDPDGEDVEYEVGSVLVYACDPGYEITNGTETRECLSNFSWTGATPVCVGVSCGPPGEVDHGETTGHHHYHDTVSLTCDEGYELSGVDTITCQADKTWDATLGSCSRISCPAPPDVSHSNHSGGHLYGDKVTYTCHAGYGHARGDLERWCLSNGTWNGSEPICLRTCGQPDHTHHARVTVSDGCFVNDSAAYSCKPGYVYASGDFVRICKESGDWSGFPLTCWRLSCGDPGHVSHASREGGVRFEDLMVFTCDEGYLTDGNNSIVCKASGQWSGQLPVCISKRHLPWMFACEISSHCP